VTLPLDRPAFKQGHCGCTGRGPCDMDLGGSDAIIDQHVFAEDVH
jgi:hypothetical protein